MITIDNNEIKSLVPKLIKIRRDLHQYPEEGWTEFRTTVKIIEEAERLGLPYKFGKSILSAEHMYGVPSQEQMALEFERGLSDAKRPDLINEMRDGYTGCIVEIKGEHDGPVIAFRVDIDCNNVQETASTAHIPNQLGFASKRPNLMHACGHDGHVAIGIGVMTLLAKHRSELKGTVRLIFQPAEEGARGGYAMSSTGFMEDVQYLLGCHLGIKAKDVGTVITGCHGFLASTKIDVTYTGKSSHAAISPEEGKNALTAAATATLNLLAIPRHSRGASRVNVGILNAGSGRNVIPGSAYMAIETRGADNEINEYVKACAKRICESAAQMHDCGCETRIVGLNRNAYCDKDFADFIANMIKDIDGVNNIQTDADFGGGEDIAFMMNDVHAHGGKATEILVGCGLKAPHHSPDFDIDERALPIGVSVITTAIINIMNNNGNINSLTK